MIIALDYDGTFTEDREGWSLFVHMMKQRGHEISFVTFRGDFGTTGLYDNEDIRTDAKKLDIPVVFTAGKQKKHIFYADVWIDDMPEVVVPYHQLADIKRGCEANGDTG